MSNSRRPGLSSIVGAMGIVYGDIGTSPLYALQQAVGEAGTFDAAAVRGVLSLIFWALAISVTLKYLTIIMRADNEGEGGILALFALAQRRLIHGSTWAKVCVGLALAGTAFFFCDALITPAISVLSAVEGLELLSPDLKEAVIPITLIVLAILFAYQRHGTARVGSLFGPVMVIWFLVIAVIGIFPILRHPQVLAALDPRHGASLLLTHGFRGFLVLGAVFDEISAMLITLPLVLPVIQKLGLTMMPGTSPDMVAVWWGIINVVIIELGMIIPPIGIIVFILHGLAPQIPIRTIYRGVTPFIIADLVLLALLTLFPAISTWLPAVLPS